MKNVKNYPIETYKNKLTISWRKREKILLLLCPTQFVFPTLLSLSTYTSALLTTRAPEFYRNKVNPYWPVWAPREDKVLDGRGQSRRRCLESLLRKGGEEERAKEEEEGREACC